MPAGRSMRSPWFAIIITVPFRVTPFPKVTSPDTVRWSNSNKSGIAGNLVRNSLTYVENFTLITKYSSSQISIMYNYRNETVTFEK